MADWKEALERLQIFTDPNAAVTDATVIRAHIEGLEAQLSEARDTNRRLNRRVQEAEAAIPSYRKLVAEPPNGDGVRFVNGNMGRALLAHYCNQATERAEAAERDARAKQARIDELMLEYCPDEMTPEQVAEWKRHQAIATTEQAPERAGRE